MSKVDKLYLVTREDLDPGQQAVQAAHSLREFVELHPEIDRAWYKQSNTLAFLVVADEPALGVLLQKAANRNCPVAPFHEPDRNNEMTAIALGPAARNLCSGLRLALAGPRCRSSEASSGFLTPVGEGFDSPRHHLEP